MKVIHRTADANISEIDRGCRYKFDWGWLDECVEENNRIGDFIRKVDVAGKVLCEWCNDPINYANRGKLAITAHVKTKKHQDSAKIRSTNYALSAGFFGSSSSSAGATSTTASMKTYGIHPAFKQFVGTSNDTEDVPKPITPLDDRSTNLQAMVVGSLAEHSLPFTVAPVIVSLMKEAARDPKATQKLSLDRCTASYKLSKGLARTMAEETLAEVRSTHFSLNVDESTSNNLKKVLAILISYCSSKCGEVVVEHLASVELERTTAETVFGAIISTLEEKSIPLDKMVSCLMDSCNVMRGSKNGVEQKLREKVPQLLDIDGDSCHHIHNAAKKFCAPFTYHCEGLFKDIFNDMKYSPDLRDSLTEICEILNLKFTMPEQFVPHRWLSAYDLSLSTLRLLEPLYLFYFSFLSAADKLIYQEIQEEILTSKSVSPDAKKLLKNVQSTVSQKNMTEDGKSRKRRIFQKLIFQREYTGSILNLYSSVLALLKQYVCLFELKEPMIHKLHDQQAQLFKNFLGLFVKSEKLKHAKTSDIIKLDLTSSANLRSDIFLGAPVTGSTKTQTDFRSKVLSAYQDCGAYLQSKLPINNKLLKAMSALDPLANEDSVFGPKLRKLPAAMGKKLSSTEAMAYDLEITKYLVDAQLPSTALRLDHYWLEVQKTERYPLLCSYAMPLLTIFHGPQVEGSFSTMGDIIDPKSCRTNIETYSAIQTVKYGLRARKTTAVGYLSKKDVLHDQVSPALISNMTQAYKRTLAERTEKKEEAAAKRQRLDLPDKPAQTKAAFKETEKEKQATAVKDFLSKFKRTSK